MARMNDSMAIRRLEALAVHTPGTLSAVGILPEAPAAVRTPEVQVVCKSETLAVVRTFEVHMPGVPVVYKPVAPAFRTPELLSAAHKPPRSCSSSLEEAADGAAVADWSEP